MRNKRVQTLEQCVHHLSDALGQQQAVEQCLEGVNTTMETLQALIDEEKVEEAAKYLYHSKYGILKKNAIQLGLE
jgi:DNA-binding MurR/RpiR family transcriptional regulator